MRTEALQPCGAGSPSTAVAIEKSMTTPDASAIDVIGGALAVAGSNRKRDSRNGSDMPITLPPTTTICMVSTTNSAISGPPRQSPRIDTATAIVAPNTSAAIVSSK